MTPDYVRKHEVWVVEEAGDIAGFYGLIHHDKVCDSTTSGSCRLTSVKDSDGSFSSMLSSEHEWQVLSGWNGKPSQTPPASTSEWADGTCEPRRACWALPSKSLAWNLKHDLDLVRHEYNPVMALSA